MLPGVVFLISSRPITEKLLEWHCLLACLPASLHFSFSSLQTDVVNNFLFAGGREGRLLATFVVWPMLMFLQGFKGLFSLQLTKEVVAVLRKAFKH